MQVSARSGSTETAPVPPGCLTNAPVPKKSRGPRIDAIRVRAIIEIAINNLPGKIKPSSVIDWLITDCLSADGSGDQIIMQAIDAGVLITAVWIEGRTLHFRDITDEDHTLTLTPDSLKRPLKHVKEKLAEDVSYLDLWRERQEACYC